MPLFLYIFAILFSNTFTPFLYSFLHIDTFFALYFSLFFQVTTKISRNNICRYHQFRFPCISWRIIREYNKLSSYFHDLLVSYSTLLLPTLWMLFWKVTCWPKLNDQLLLLFWIQFLIGTKGMLLLSRCWIISHIFLNRLQEVLWKPFVGLL